MARRTGRAPRCVDRPETAAADDASAWARFLRRLSEADRATVADETAARWARFLRRLAAHGEHDVDER